MKVCFVTANYPPEVYGGTEQVVTALARELSPHGVEVVVISGSDEPHAGEDVQHEQHHSIAVHRLRRSPGEGDHHGFVRPRLLALVRELVEQERPDVLHVHSLASIGAGLGEIARELGIPFVMTFHDLYVICARYFRVPVGGVSCPVDTDRTPCVTCINATLRTDPAVVAEGLAERDRLLGAETALADACTAPSSTAAAFIRDGLAYAGRIEVIPHGLLREVAPEDRAPPPQKGELLRVGTFGGLVPDKGVLELIDAVTGLPCELHLSGRLYGGEIKQRLQLRAPQGLRCVLHGPYTPERRHPARNLHLAVFPSKCQETYGLVVDEALAHGVPTVVSDAGALRERIGTPGVVVTEVAQLAPVLRELVASPARLSALRAAIPATLPTIAASARRHHELYSRLR
ncbi:MAG TPA: glycosyltransferase [Planctomycetota bacterium]